MSSTNPTRLTENMGPCEADCPAAILDLLSPTEHEYALDWRARCRANLAHRARKLAGGDRIRLPAPVTFTDRKVAPEFGVCKRGRAHVLRARTGSEVGRARVRQYRYHMLDAVSSHK